MAFYLSGGEQVKQLKPVDLQPEVGKLYICNSFYFPNSIVRFYFGPWKFYWRFFGCSSGSGFWSKRSHCGGILLYFFFVQLHSMIPNYSRIYLLNAYTGIECCFSFYGDVK